ALHRARADVDAVQPPAGRREVLALVAFAAGHFQQAADPAELPGDDGAGGFEAVLLAGRGHAPGIRDAVGHVEAARVVPATVAHRVAHPHAPADAVDQACA